MLAIARAAHETWRQTMSSNRGVVYLGQGKVEVQSIDYPKMVDPRGRAIGHGVILKVVSTNICGSDQHMVRGRTTAEVGLVLGHEITGEVIEIGPRRGDAQDRRSGFGAVQRGLRPLPDLQGAAHRRVPERESVACGRRVWLRGHGRLDRRPGRVRDGPVCRLQSAEISRPRAGDVEDPRPHVSLRHPADRLSRRGDGGRQTGRHRVYRGRGAGRAWRRPLRRACWARPARSSAT